MKATSWFQNGFSRIRRRRHGRQDTARRSLLSEPLERRDLLAADLFGFQTVTTPMAADRECPCTDSSSADMDEAAMWQTRAGAPGENTDGGPVRGPQAGPTGGSASARDRNRSTEDCPADDSDQLLKNRVRVRDADTTSTQTQTQLRNRRVQAVEDAADRLVTRQQDRLADRTTRRTPVADRLQKVLQRRDRDGDGDGDAGVCQVDCPIRDDAGDPVASIQLSQDQIDGLRKMREEEKLARDVYLALADTWDAPIFSNIAQAESRHMAAVGGMIEKYGLDDPVTDDTPGEFASAEFAALYDTLVEAGSTSLVDGLQVGALIEDMDIYDLQGLLTADDLPSDVRAVYENLMRGSRNHLRAFVTQLEAAGATYAAGDYLTQVEIDDIVSSPIETGNGARAGRRDRRAAAEQRNRDADCVSPRTREQVFAALGRRGRGA